MKEITLESLPPCFEKWCAKFDDLWDNKGKKIGFRCYLAGLNLHLYTFANPRAGDENFARSFDSLQNIYRVANSEDIVPTLPLPSLAFVSMGFLARKLNFEHVGIPLVFTTQKGTVQDNHIIPVYKEALWASKLKETGLNVEKIAMTDPNKSRELSGTGKSNNGNYKFIIKPPAVLSSSPTEVIPQTGGDTTEVTIFSGHDGFEQALPWS
ncbi:MAG: hypothetical protein QNJ54_19770 [Prochloraceae cyanobacterium]|nr:hypothetical protein [Prochloraceae cyanobacterium]